MVREEGRPRQPWDWGSVPQASESRPENEVSTDVFYAVVAAIYLDSGMTALKSFTLPLIRSCDSESHYERGAEGKVLTADMPTEETAQDGVHIQNARRGRRSGAISLGITRALTVNKNEPVKNSEKNTQVKAKNEVLDKSESDGTTKTVKSSGLSGLFSLRGRGTARLGALCDRCRISDKRMAYKGICRIAGGVCPGNRCL